MQQRQMTFLNWFFGLWGMLNIVALLATFFGDSSRAMAKTAAPLLLISGPPFQIVLDGRMPFNLGLLTVFLITMSAVTVHTNLVVMRKCQDIIHSRLELEGHGKMKPHKRK